MLSSHAASLQQGVPITTPTFALERGTTTKCKISLVSCYLVHPESASIVTKELWLFAHILLSVSLVTNMVSVAWLIGWALILEYTIGGSSVARGISPNLVMCYIKLTDI
jgi:hypothetical protein